MSKASKNIADLLRQENSDSYTSRPTSSQVGTVNTDNDTMTVNTVIAGSPTVGIPHPYIGPNSWIRAYPESGSPVLLQARAEDKTYVAMGYYRDSPLSTEREATDAIIPVGKRRKMYVGEVEISSKNQGQFYADRRGNVEIRSGLMQLHVNQDRLETSMYAGTHIREISGRNVGLGPVMTDQERFGLIKRSPINVAFEAYFGGTESKVPTSPFQGTGSPVMGKEYVRNISTRPTANAPSLIPVVDHREGTTVVDDLGNVDMIPIATLPPVKGPFRFRSRWYVQPNASVAATAPFTSLDVGMDLSGNVGVNLPIAGSLNVAAQGTQGGKINLVAANSMSFLMGAQGLTINTSGTVGITANFVQFSTPFGSPQPISRIGDTVSIDLAILSTAIAPLIVAPNGGGPCSAPAPVPASIVAGTIASGNTSLVG